MYVKEETQNNLTIEKSFFLTYLKRCKSEEEFKEYLTFIKKKHYDATHVCSAFICGDIKRSNDDGEPSGTAGRPILNALEKNDMDQTCALVVRYFGGIKLGTGGLTRAYSNSVTEALKNATLAKEIVYPAYKLTISYELANKIQHYLENNTLMISKDYDENVTFRFGVDDENKLIKIREMLKGIEPEYYGDKTVEVII